MKRLSIIILSLVSCVCMYAQGLNLGVVTPDEAVDGVSANAYKTIGTKLERMIANCGGTSENSGSIVLFPVINFIQDDMIEGGMRNIYSIEYELIIKAVSPSSNSTFGTVTWHLTGKGYSKGDAVKEGVNKLMANDSKFAAFYKQIVPKIKNYFVSHKASMISKAKSLASQKQYEEAIALLCEYPSGIAGYDEVQTAISSVYRQYANANCSQIVQQARSKFAVQDYDGASALLADVDMTSPCAAEAKALANSIRTKINRDQAAERAQELAEKRIEASVEKTRINANARVASATVKAAATVASAYYKSHRVTYHVLCGRPW